MKQRCYPLCSEPLAGRGIAGVQDPQTRLTECWSVPFYSWSQFKVPSRAVHPQPWCGQHQTSSDVSSRNVYNYSNQEDKEKTPMCRIAELARFHKLKHEYKLMDESGPHKKMFTVQLFLTAEEVFEGSGASIKKAQQAAAAAALAGTSLAMPPEKKRKKGRRARGEKLYVLTTSHFLPFLLPILYSIGSQNISIVSSKMPLCSGPLLGPLPPVNPLFMMPPTSRSGAVFPLPPSSERLCMVSVAIGPGLMFTAIGSTFGQAKANAAAQVCESSTETNGESDTLPKHKQKSVISQVHECALQMKLNVEFEVVKEVGPPHDRSYVVRCSLKNPKNEVSNARDVVWAAHPISENSPLFIASSLYKLQKRVLNPSREPKRKTIIKDMKMDPTYGHQINPVSRLIQVLQARNEEEPQFELVSEQGQSRYKEFTVQVSCGSRICSGSGPNKRLAKRAAAEAMLAEIGYVKPLPPPGKSLLKKKMDSQGLCIDEHNGQQARVDASWSSSNDGDADASNVPPSPGRRRVTFSNQVKACPPPDDSKYPEPELAPLKADVLVEGRVKRIRRTKENCPVLIRAQCGEYHRFFELKNAKNVIPNFPLTKNYFSRLEETVVGHVRTSLRFG
ncbi:unnamed protein product [Heligmosomoides polygyrus]|uniref:DRBM domain-containing protein n=1 Tax=Heligmosomoides polygyrus TaxID=6339 RepID=A0A3P8BUQ0_HELPZ|nr:unnamed protein product [Heligmosomoides polygyrus]